MEALRWLACILLAVVIFGALLGVGGVLTAIGAIISTMWVGIAAIALIAMLIKEWCEGESKDPE